MAIGDKARAAGLTTYSDAQDRRLGYENDNQNADYIAEDRARLAVLEDSVNQPVFSCTRSTSTLALRDLRSGVWTVAAGAFGTPELNQGFARWNSTTGVLAVFRPGVYRMHAHLDMSGTPDNYSTVAVQITRNTTEDNTAGTLAKGRTDGTSADALGSRFLDADDELRVLVYQANPGATTRAIGIGSYDLTLSLEWVRS